MSSEFIGVHACEYSHIGRLYNVHPLFTMYLIPNIDLSPLGKWREHPVAVTAYSYGFGALFMAIASLYFVFTGQTDAFYLPPDVSGHSTHKN